MFKIFSSSGLPAVDEAFAARRPVLDGLKSRLLRITKNTSMKYLITTIAAVGMGLMRDAAAGHKRGAMAFLSAREIVRRAGMSCGCNKREGAVPSSVEYTVSLG